MFGFLFLLCKGVLIVSAVISTVVIYLMALILFPLRHSILKKTYKFFLFTWLRYNGIIVRLSGTENIPKQGAIFVSNKCDELVYPLLYYALPDNTLFFWSSNLFPELVLKLLRPFSILPLNQYNLIAQRKHFSAVEAYKRSHNFSIIVNNTTSKKLTRELCSTAPAYLAIQHDLPLVPVAVLLPGRLILRNPFKPATIAVIIGRPLLSQNPDTSRESRGTLTDDLFLALDSALSQDNPPVTRP